MCFKKWQIPWGKFQGKERDEFMTRVWVVSGLIGAEGHTHTHTHPARTALKAGPQQVRAIMLSW